MAGLSVRSLGGLTDQSINILDQVSKLQFVDIVYLLSYNFNLSLD